MFFILQKEGNHIDDIEVFALQEILDRQKFVHQYTFMKMKDFDGDKEFANHKIKEAIPVGSIDFVEAFLKRVHGIEKMNPIEVPNVLRKDKYVKRKYSIVEKKHFPKTGYYFTKYVSSLKEFSHIGSAEELQYRKQSQLKEGYYQVSEVVDIVSEYRCFILEDEIIGIQFYDGDCTVMPNEEDIALLKEMVETYKSDETRPMAYTLDVGIIRYRGLALLECHPHVSVGLYGLHGKFLSDCYKYGFEWYVKQNQEIEPFDNFHTFKREEYVRK